MPSQLNGTTVPRDLYDYVSFVNEPPSAITPVPPGRKSKESKAKTAKAKQKTAKMSRGRGRPPSISNSTDGLVSPAVDTPGNLDTSVDMADSAEQQQEAMIGDDVSAYGDEGNDNADRDNEANEMWEQNQDDQAEEGALNSSMQEDNGLTKEDAGVKTEAAEAESQAEQTLSAEGASSSNVVTEPGPDIELEQVHPLIGLWEGTFNVKAAVGKFCTHLHDLQFITFLLCAHED